jgi:metal-responsive CopG/Arc/MetJ family transcriptional regulator
MITTTIRMTKEIFSMIDRVIEKTGIKGRSHHIRRAVYEYCKRILNETTN